MRIRDLVTEIALNLRRKKLRSFLTICGVAIGAFTISVIFLLSAGLKNFLETRMETVTSPRYIDCFPPGGIDPKKVMSMLIGSFGGPPKELNDDAPSPSATFGMVQAVYFNQEHLAKIQSIPEVEFVSPTVFFPGHWIRLKGSERKFEVNFAPWRAETSRTVICGNGFSGGDEVVLPYTYVRALGYDDPTKLVGQEVEIEVGKHPLLVRYLSKELINPLNPLGLLRQFMGSAENKEDSLLNFTPIQHFTARIAAISEEEFFGSVAFPSMDLIHRMGRFFFHQPDLFTENNYGLAVRICVDREENVPQVQEQLRREGMFSITTEDRLGAFGKFFWVVESVLGLFGLIAFAVAALGIINTLIMSVYERKREIGILKALGATRGMIRLAFALEAAAIGIVGGLLGIACSCSTALLGNFLARHYYPQFWSQLPLFYIQWHILLLILLFSTVIGLLAGLYPASRAARLDPIEVLRYE